LNFVRALAVVATILASVLLSASTAVYASGTPPIVAVYVTVDGVRDLVSVAVRMGGDDPALQAQISGVLTEVLGSSQGSFGLTRNESGVFISVTVRGVLRYIASDEELFISYMNYTVASSSSGTCSSALGRLGFDLDLLIPKELREIIDRVGAGRVVFRIVSPYLDESSLRAIAEEMGRYLRGDVSASGNTLVITLGSASEHACMPYENWFWKLFGVPRAVAIIPPDSLDRCTVYSYILLKIRVWYVPLRNITAVYTPPTGLVPRCAGGWGTVVLCHSNKTSIRFSAPYSTERFVAGANLVAMKPGVYELGKVRLTYCLPTSGLCTGADIPVYVSRTGKTALTVREYQCFSGPDYRFWVETLPVIGAIATLAVVAILIAVNLTRRRKPL